MVGKDDDALARMATMGESVDSRTAPAVAPDSVRDPARALSLLPWEERDDRIFDLTGLVVEGEEGICEPRDRAFVVLACNSFDGLLAACEAAYLSLLKLPTIERIGRQKELCALRDAIAGATGRTDRDVQDAFTAMAEGR